MQRQILRLRKLDRVRHSYSSGTHCRCWRPRPTTTRQKVWRPRDVAACR